jgi:DNA-binding SARP family transcriptional activator
VATTHNLQPSQTPSSLSAEPNSDRNACLDQDRLLRLTAASDSGQSSNSAFLGGALSGGRRGSAIGPPLAAEVLTPSVASAASRAAGTCPTGGARSTPRSARGAERAWSTQRVIELRCRLDTTTTVGVGLDASQRTSPPSILRRGPVAGPVVCNNMIVHAAWGETRLQTSALEIRLFGQVSVRQDGQPRSDLSAKALELLCYLLLHRDRGHTRETLAGVLWPEASDSASKKYLRQTLWQLHSTLVSRAGPRPANGEALLTLDPGWVRVNPKAGWWLDVAAFEQAYRLCRETPGQDLTGPQAHTLEAAVALYRGDLIETWYQDWCIYERDRLQLTYLAMLEQLMGHCEARQWYAKGLGYGQCILRYDPARESTHRQLMRLYYQAGDRTTSLRQYDRCAAVVAKHFNVRPSRETGALYHQIRTDRLEGTSAQTAVERRLVDEPGSSLLLDLHTRLDHIQTSLSALQDQLQQEMTAVRRELRTERETSQQTRCEMR